MLSVAAAGSITVCKGHERTARLRAPESEPHAAGSGAHVPTSLTPVVTNNLPPKNTKHANQPLTLPQQQQDHDFAATVAAVEAQVVP